MTRRRAQVACRARRRLGFEVMEGRLMLSATSMQVTTLSLRGTELNLQTGNQFIYVATPIEGGYIPLNVPPTGMILDSDALLTPRALHDLITNGTLSTNGHTWTYFNSGDSTSNGIRPVAIISNGGGSFQLIPIPAEGANPGIESSEGGPIAIATILEEMPGIMEEKGESLPTALVGEFSGAEREQLRSKNSPTDDDTMSGEVDRAIVFEMAGGDPVGIGQPAAHNGTYNENPLDDAPLSLRPQQRGADQTPSELTEVGVHESPAPEPRDLTSATVEYRGYFRERGFWLESQADPGAVITKTFAEQSNSQMSTSAVHSYTDSDSAYAEAFVQLAEHEKSIRYYVADGAARRGLSAVPLLTLLALERVAARNSRRANMLAAAAVPRRPATGEGETDADA